MIGLKSFRWSHTHSRERKKELLSNHRFCSMGISRNRGKQLLSLSQTSCWAEIGMTGHRRCRSMFPRALCSGRSEDVLKTSEECRSVEGDLCVNWTYTSIRSHLRLSKRHTVQAGKQEFLLHAFESFGCIVVELIVGIASCWRQKVIVGTRGRSGAAIEVTFSVPDLEL